MDGHAAHYVVADLRFLMDGPRRADFAPLFPNLVIFIGVMDMLENTDDAGGKTDRIVQV